ncbi:MAG: sigma-70 family RNA polymerase sigma factor [Planctomycetes bacterium]|nr:sigma-70 family RNA polymerase sigma factor [Planctomycetota bacterium]
MARPARDSSDRIAPLLDQQRWLRRLAATLVVDAAAADDVAQETLRIALEQPPRDTRHPRAWLATVARSVARRLGLAGASRTQREQQAAAREAQPAADEVVARAELQHAVSAALLALAEPYRTTLLLRFVDALPPRTIAARTGVPVETVRTRTKRGLELLRERLTATRGAPPRTWAPALLGLLDGGLRRVVRREVARVASGAGGSAAGGASGSAAAAGAAALALSGALFVSTKLKLAVATVLLVGGSFAVAKLLEAPTLPAPDRAAAAAREPEALAAPAESVAPLAAAAEAERVALETSGRGAGEAAGGAADVAPLRCTFEGRVVDAGGRPVEGAFVLLERADTGSARCGSLIAVCDRAEELLAEARDPAGVAPPAKAAPLRHAQSDAAGRFAFEGVEKSAATHLVALHEREGIAVAVGLVVNPATPPPPHELVLPGGLVLHGEVRDRDGQPIAGAILRPMVWQGEGEKRSGFSIGSATSDANGRYRTLPWPWRDLGMTCFADGYAAQERALLVVHADERDHREDFTLERAVRHEGAIVLADGSPAKLRTLARTFHFCASNLEPTEQAGDPKMLGGGELDLANDRWSFTWEHARWVSLWCERKLLGRAAVTEAQPNPDLVVDLSDLPEPPRTTRLALEVVDGASGAPVAAYALQVARTFHEAMESREPSQRRTVEAADGRVTLEGLTPGLYEVVVRADGFAPRIALLTAPLEPPPLPQVIALAIGDAALSGSVVAEDGTPQAGVFVDLLQRDGTVALPHPDYRVTTNAAGAFAFRNVPSGDYLVGVQPPARLEGRRPAPAVVRARTGEDDVRVVLQAPVHVTLDVRFPKGVLPLYLMRVRNADGDLVIDGARPEQWSMCAGEQQALDVAPGAYTVELLSPRHHGGPVRFLAVEGERVVIEVTP